MKWVEWAEVVVGGDQKLALLAQDKFGQAQKRPSTLEGTPSSGRGGFWGAVGWNWCEIGGLGVVQKGLLCLCFMQL